MVSSYLVYGLGITGLNLTKYLLKKGEKVFLIDDNQKSIDNAKFLLKDFKNLNFLKFGDIKNKLDNNSVILFSPGIPLHFPVRHKILNIVDDLGCKLICDVELFYLLNKNHNFIGITGTNGKSTTAFLVDFILREIGKKSYLAGNIGVACFDLMLRENIQENANFVLEISSYQLDLMKETRFNVAALTNISVDHIDRHGNFENYVLTKRKIFNNQSSRDFAIFNIDDENSRKIYKDKGLNSKLIFVSTQKIVENGVCVIDGFLYNKIAENNEKFPLQNLVLKGEHNMQNIAMAFACVYLILIQNKLLQNDTTQKIIDAILKFKGLKHRLQFLGNIDGVNFINDSKATNAQSTQKALDAYDNIFWILGGVAKEGGISSLAKYFPKIKKAYLIGKSSDEFGEILQKNNVNFIKCGDLDNAFKKSFFDAKNAGLKERNLLLSPACASFDQWKNFEERGDYFCKKFDDIAKG